MRRLSQITILLLCLVHANAQKSPHGENFTLSCKDCHKTSGWTFDPSQSSFNHATTGFPLVGHHLDATCRDCHASLTFAGAPKECAGCHADIHEQTVGNDCSRCHTPNSWMVPNMTQLHEMGRFPLLGAHRTAECRDCHTNLVSPGSATPSKLRFDPLSIECYDCHKENYASAKKPDHMAGNYSKHCTDCHSINSFSWSGAGINHDFFPLVDGHSGIECIRCHTTGTFEKISADCFACHQPEFQSATNPSHTSLAFPTDCKTCHSLAPGWKPADYKDHDALSFPIYSGTHSGEWDKCSDCHTNPSNYKEFTCISCHEHNKGSTDDEHEGVSGYLYSSEACYACHPTGSSEGSFNHNNSAFPLSGAHSTTACDKCHTTGYQGTTTICYDCHTNQFNQSLNPNHISKAIPNDCAMCHTTDPGWKPAAFPIHNDYYKLEGAHLTIANECATCHQGNYINSPNTCYGCHAVNYNQTVNPNHITAQFLTECEACHTQSSWAPASFDHNISYPLTGAHTAISNECNRCHANGYSNTPNTCAGCHQTNYNQSLNPNHASLNLPNDCAMCHTTQPDWKPATFPIHNNYYVLQGAHAAISNECATCHQGNYINSPNTCYGCHAQAYSQTTNPNHSVLQFPTDCQVCHSQTAWVPASFDHNSVYPLTGAHASVANNCNQCHANGYANTPNTCAGCHQAAYNQSLNPNHVNLGIPNDCAMCHTTNPGWQPAQFPIHNNYYVLAGAHAAIANQCTTCHQGNYNSTPNTCAGCHMTNYNQATNPNHLSSQFPTSCEMCHTQNSWSPSTFNHDSQYFPIYSGSHQGAWTHCSDCHSNPSNYASFTCTTACHPQNQMNNEHQGVSGYSYNSTACLNCHPNGSAGGMMNRNRFIRSN